MSPSSSSRVAMAMSADRGCSIEHTMGYRGGGRLTRGKGEPMVGVGYKGSKGPAQRKDMGEAKPTDPQPIPHLQTFAPAVLPALYPRSLLHLILGPQDSRQTPFLCPSSALSQLILQSVLPGHSHCHLSFHVSDPCLLLGKRVP